MYVVRQRLMKGSRTDQERIAEEERERKRDMSIRFWVLETKGGGVCEQLMKKYEILKRKSPKENTNFMLFI